MKLTKFESDIIKHILNDWGVSNKLLFQPDRSEIISRIFTGIGFFRIFFVNDINLKIWRVLSSKRDYPDGLMFLFRNME